MMCGDGVCAWAPFNQTDCKNIPRPFSFTVKICLQSLNVNTLEHFSTCFCLCLDLVAVERIEMDMQCTAVMKTFNVLLQTS